MGLTVAIAIAITIATIIEYIAFDIDIESQRDSETFE